jgi:hypothetical protein
MFINIFTILLMLTDHQLSLESSGRTHHILPKTGIMTEKLQTTTEFVTNLDSDDHRHQPLGDNNLPTFWLVHWLSFYGLSPRIGHRQSDFNNV